MFRINPGAVMATLSNMFGHAGEAIALHEIAKATATTPRYYSVGTARSPGGRAHKRWRVRRASGRA